MAHSQIDVNGFKVIEAMPISKVGVFPYLGRQIDFDGSLGLVPDRIYWVFRSPEELFDPEAIRSFNGKPFIDEHEMLGEGFTPVDQRPADGTIYNVRPSRDMPDYLIADCNVFTDKMIRKIADGKRELSLGYRCHYEPRHGTYDGKEYDFVQTDLRGNHIALVKHGRCGSSVCVCDGALITMDSLPEEIPTMNDMEDKPDEGSNETRLRDMLGQCLNGGDEQGCQDLLDFLSLTPEERRTALAAAKNPASTDDEEDAPATDDGAVPTPPAPGADEPEEPAAPSPEAEATAPAPAAAEPDDAATAAALKQYADAKPADAPAAAPEEPAADCGDLAAAPATVTEPSAPVPVAAANNDVPADADEDADADATATAPEEPTADCADPDCTDPTCTDPDCHKDGETDADPEADAAAPAAAPATDCKAAPKKGAPKSAAKKDAPAAKPALTQDALDRLTASIRADYNRAQKLAATVRPLVGAFDSGAMSEVEVARYAVRRIPCLAFAADAADAVVLGAVRGYVADRESRAAAKKTVKVPTADEAPRKPATTVVDDAADAARALKMFYR